MPKKTPLLEEHLKLHATMTGFHGWQLPVYYSMPIEEHNAVRQNCGLFDVSHMGEILVQGNDAEKLLQLLLVRDIDGMKPRQIRLAAMCNEQGCILDDLTVYKFSEQKFWLVVNAGPYEGDLRWVQRNAKGMDAKAEGLRSNTAKLDLQGPKAELALQKLVKENLKQIKFYNFKEMKINGINCIVSRSGYTGEDGFEIYFDKKHAEKMWNELMLAGSEFNLKPCGLAARDTLRLEAGMLLYGQDIDEMHSILQCPYEKIICWEKGFVGKKALQLQLKQAIGQKLVGFELLERGIARHGSRIIAGGKETGIVTSGTFAPTLKKGIGLGYIGKDFSAVGTEFDVEIRGRRARAVVAKTPFYRRGG